MEYLSKREYLRRYVSRVDQLRIGVLGLLVLFGGAIGIALGLRGQNHGLALWGLLIAVLGLGILQFQSLACSVGTMVCGLAGVTGLIGGMNPICGGLLILAAIGAIRLTYLLNRDYRSYRDSSAPASSPQNRQALSKGDGPAAAAVFIPLLGMMCSMGLIAFSLSPFFLEQLVGHARTPEELLQGYSQWYIAVISAVASAILIGAVAVILYWKWGIGVEKGIRLILLTMAFPLLLGGFMLLSEEVPTLLIHSWEDLAQIRSGELSEETVWLSSKTWTERLPGPYSSGQPEPVIRYGATGMEPGGGWEDFYIPENLGFRPDPEALYKESQSISWNEEHAQKYRLRFTDHFRLVVSVEPVEE